LPQRTRLEALNASKGVEHIPKHPWALMEQLGNVETEIATQIACNNFKCDRLVASIPDSGQ